VAPVHNFAGIYDVRIAHRCPLFKLLQPTRARTDPNRSIVLMKAPRKIPRPGRKLRGYSLSAKSCGLQATLPRETKLRDAMHVVFYDAHSAVAGSLASPTILLYLFPAWRDVGCDSADRCMIWNYSSYCPKNLKSSAICSDLVRRGALRSDSRTSSLI
jgi:hypothetical protein